MKQISMKIENKIALRSVIIFAIFFCVGCAGRIPHRPLSAQEFRKVDFNTIVPERFWGDDAPQNLDLFLKKQAVILKKRFPQAINSNSSNAPMYGFLAISGGGANGAFGAGLLAGWTESGKRPKFEVVTGVSTGAIIAPFAFLGSEYDEKIIELYSTVSRRDIFRKRSALFALLFRSALTDTKPLRKLIDQHITPDLVAKIAKQDKLQRKLFIMTTQLDALRPVVWDIGAIASRRGQKGVELIKRIILASTAIPAFFPPVPIEWESNGKIFTELHVDGAVSRTVFAYPAQVNAQKINNKLGLKFRRNIFVIQNSNVQTEYEPMSAKLSKIAERAMSGMLMNQANSNVEQIYYLAKRDGIEFNMIAIPNDFQADKMNEFDPAYMKKLLELGRKIGRGGNFWKHKPPSEES